MRPINRLQSEAYARYLAEQKAYQEEIEDWLSQSKSERGDKPEEPPPLEHFYTVDATPEALTDIAASSAGVVINQDELAGWVLSFDAYRKGGERQRHLSLWAGAPLKVDRVTKKRPAYVERPAISVTGGIQPDMLNALSEEAERRDGFLERFLWAVPHIEPAYWSTRTVDGAVEDAMEKVFSDLRYSHVAAVRGVPEPIVLCDRAREIWVGWYNENADITNKAHGMMAGVSAKLSLQCGRLALILHALAHPADLNSPLSGETMEAAIVLTEWFRGQAFRALSLIVEAQPQPHAALTLRVLSAVREAGTDGLTRTELQAVTGRNLTAAQLDEVVDALIAQERIERTEAPPSGSPGRPAVRYFIGDDRDARDDDSFVPSFLRTSEHDSEDESACPNCGVIEAGHACEWEEA